MHKMAKKVKVLAEILASLALKKLPFWLQKQSNLAWKSSNWPKNAQIDLKMSQFSLKTHKF